MILLLMSNGYKVEIKPVGKTKYFMLEELQGLVGGSIQIVNVRRGILVVNEDGKPLNLPVNKEATRLAEQLIVGNAIFAKDFNTLVGPKG